MTQVLIGLIGVIVGGMLTALSSWLLDLLRDRRDRQRQVQQETRELKRAARLVGEELSENLYMLCRAVEFRRWWRHPAHSLRTTRWDEYEPVFAGAEMEDEAWYSAAAAYQVVRELLGAAEGRLRLESSPFTVEDDRSIRTSIEVIDGGWQALAALNGERGLTVEPDAVAAMFTAARDAARNLLADDGGRASPFVDREELRVVSDDRPVVGIALLRAPNWVSYPCRLPLGSKLTVLIPEIEGTRACAVSPLGQREADSDMARKFVPDEIRLAAEYSDFVLLLRLPEDQEMVVPWRDEASRSGTPATFPTVG